MKIMVAIGDEFEDTYNLSADEISEFAGLVGDMNPLHHDPDYAAQSRFGKIIVSGPHISALMLAIPGDQLSNENSMLGLTFEVEFKKAVLCDQDFTIHWEVTGIEKKSTGNLVVSKLTLKTGDEICAVATNKSIVYD